MNKFVNNFLFDSLKLVHDGLLKNFRAKVICTRSSSIRPDRRNSRVQPFVAGGGHDYITKASSVKRKEKYF